MIRGIVNPKDVGLFQINTDYHLKDSKDLGYNIFTPKGNVQYAMHLLKEDGVSHWKASKDCWSKKD